MNTYSNTNKTFRNQMKIITITNIRDNENNEETQSTTLPDKFIEKSQLSTFESFINIIQNSFVPNKNFQIFLADNHGAKLIVDTNSFEQIKEKIISTSEDEAYFIIQIHLNEKLLSSIEADKINLESKEGIIINIINYFNFNFMLLDKDKAKDVDDYLEHKIKPIFEPLITSLAYSRPNNAVITLFNIEYNYINIIN